MGKKNQIAIRLNCDLNFIEEWICHRVRWPRDK